MKAKQLTNFRASGGKDDAIRLTPPKKMTLEQAIAYIDDDEMVEVTPKSIRLRKRYPRPQRAQARQPRQGRGLSDAAARRVSPGGGVYALIGAKVIATPFMQ